MTVSRSLEWYVSHFVDLFPHDNHNSLWESVKKTVEEYASIGYITFESDKYKVVVTRGTFLDECNNLKYPISTYRVTLKSSGASWVVPRLGDCVENIVNLVDGEFDGRLSMSIENLLQELAEDICQVMTFGDIVPGWCDSRADVVDMFKLVAPNVEVIFPLTSGNRYGISYGND